MSVRIDEARSSRDTPFELDPKDTEFPKLLKELEEKLKQPKAPAMPCVSVFACSAVASGRPKTEDKKEKKSDQQKIEDIDRIHREHFAPRGDVSSEWFACVHTPLPIPKALQIPDAKAALEKEWTKLENKKAWDISTVQPRAKVIRDAKASGRSVHFGSLMDLCHIKNSQMGEEFWSFEGRTVFRETLLRTRMDNLRFSLNREPQHLVWKLLIWMLLLVCLGILVKTLTL